MNTRNQPEDFILSFLKFGSYENMIDLFENGSIYFNSIDYFQKLEEQGLRGDNYEATTKLHNLHEYKDLKVKFTFPKTGKSLEFSPSKFHLREFLSEVEGNMFCLYCLKYSDINESLNMDVDSRVKGFGSHLVLIKDVKRFLGKVRKSLDEQGINFKDRPVQYYERNKFNGNLSPFQKPSEFEFQKEYRIVLFKGGNQPYKIKIGSMKEYAHLMEVSAIDSISISLGGNKKRQG